VQEWYGTPLYHHAKFGGLGLRVSLGMKTFHVYWQHARSSVPVFRLSDFEVFLPAQIHPIISKVSDSISDLQGYARALTMPSCDGPHTISYWCSVAHTPLSCTVNQILLLISQNLKRSHHYEHIPFGGSISCMHEYSSVCISTRNLQCLASPIPKI